VLDHYSAARLILAHLRDLGHRQIAYLRGPDSSSDSGPRWKAIQEVSAELGLAIHPKLVVQLEDVSNLCGGSNQPAEKLLSANVPFTALCAYNDISAVCAMSVFRRAGRSVPHDVSVIGFDDVSWAFFSAPPLTTVRQPLFEMGRVAAQTLLDHIEDHVPFVTEIALTPELIIRDSTGPPSRP